MAEQSIVNVAPDFELLFQALQQRLEAKQTWKDLYQTSMGTTVIDMFAGAGVTNQLQIELALREAFLITAKRESSILASTRSLGVRVSRKTSANCTATLTNDQNSSAFIAPYSKFYVGDTPFYNKDQFIFGPNQEIPGIVLYEGLVSTFELDLDTLVDRVYYEVVIPSEAYTVADDNLLVYTVDKNTGGIQIWNRTDMALFEHDGNDYVYYESTDTEGRPSLIFGDGTNGAKLPQANTLKIRYVSTNGSDANGIVSGSAVTYALQSDISGRTTSTAENGTNQKGAAYYKKFAPYLFRSNRKVISDIEWRAAIVTYPGVADAFIQGQRDIAPKDPTWMNNVRVCVLPENTDTFGGANPNPRSPTWEAFREWLQQRIHRNTVIQTWNPEKILTNVHLRVAVNGAVNVQETKLKISENILTLFEKKAGILGRKLALSDITDATKQVPGVDYVEILEPTKSIEPSGKTQYVALQTTPKIDIVQTERVDSNV